MKYVARALLVSFLVLAEQAYCSSKHKQGAGLLTSDIYVAGQYDVTDNENLIRNIHKAFPRLTVQDIKDCISSCKKYPNADIIQECHDFMLWKLIQKDELTKFSSYKK